MRERYPGSQVTPHPAILPYTSTCLCSEVDFAPTYEASLLLQAYIGSPLAEEDADTELASYAAFSNDMSLLVDPENEVCAHQDTICYDSIDAPDHCL